ncbi:MAG TPA: thiamine pyrophosphate-dependent dehydrogenase E1 component subunit alpha [Candidatus Hydrogenedentes bacterium]|nr:thiamine pyrophosphate-dependent dehydrogenase E1 component subunit alpha [Candidatus Hydrogenedentota bacterium]
MLRIRRFEENLYQLYLARRIPGMSPHLSVGQEAVAVGVCQALRQQDYLLTTHRGHGHVLAKGADMNRMMAEIMGKETGYCHGRGGSMHIADVALNILGANGIVGGGLPIAVGAGLSAKCRGADAVTVCFFGDGASNIGAFHESLNMASVLRLPVVWVCENNKYALSTRIESVLSGASVAARAQSYAMPGHAVDGNDVLAVYEKAVEAVSRARGGHGPSLIEADTYRWYGHGASDNRSYRTREEENEWKKKCPIEKFKTRVLSAEIATEEEIGELEAAAEEEVQAAIRFADASPLPDPEGVMKHVFSKS